MLSILGLGEIKEGRAGGQGLGLLWGGGDCYDILAGGNMVSGPSDRLLQ